MPKVVLGAQNVMASKRKKKLSVYYRRQKIMQMLAQNPNKLQNDIAKELGVDKSTISNDIKEMNESLNVENVDAWAIHRVRVLREIEANKMECMDRMKKLKPHQGARWMEEWGKLIEKEIKILGLSSPEKLMVHQETIIKTEEHDAAVKGVMKSLEVNATNVEVGKDGVVRIPQLKKRDN